MLDFRRTGRSAGATLEEVGCDQLVFSTDYPHGDSKYPHAVESFLELKLPDDDKRKILWDNCALLCTGAAALPPPQENNQPIQQ